MLTKMDVLYNENVILVDIMKPIISYYEIEHCYFYDGTL